MKTKNFKFKSMALVLFALVLSSNVWGAEEVAYTITYTKGSSDSETTKPSIDTQKDKDGTDGTFATLSANSYAYARTNGLHLSSGKNAGNATLTLSSDGQVVASKIVTNALAKSGKSFSIEVTFTDDTTQTTNFTPGTTTTDCTLTISDANATKTIKSIYYSAASSTGTGIASTTVYTAGPSCATSPTVSAGAASGATTNSLTFNCSGGITSLGSTGCEITEYGYVYGTSSNPTTSSTTHKVGESYTTTGTAFAAHTATGLNCGTTYYMRPYAINGNGTAYGAQATLSTLDCLVDHFIDNVQETDGYTGDGKAVSTSFTKASITLSDKAATTSGSCEDVHYHFVGWVTEADRSAGNVDAGHIVNFQDSGNVPTGTTYYAVWAAEEQE